MRLADAMPSHGLYIPDVDISVRNGEASTTLEVGHVVVFDQTLVTTLADNHHWGSKQSGYAVVRTAINIEGFWGMFAVVLERMGPGGRGLVRVQGRCRARTTGTPAAGAPLAIVGASLLLSSVQTGQLGRKVIARAETLAAGTPEFADVLFGGIAGIGHASI